MIVKGKVQGVGFRYHAHYFATERNLTGWVKNLIDGTVEIVAEGPKADIQAFLIWAKKGPANARVTQVNARMLDPLDDLPEFRIAV